jgi:hypothetical protein
MVVTLRRMYKKTQTGQADVGVRGPRPVQGFSTLSLADVFKLDIILNFVLLG